MGSLVGRPVQPNRPPHAQPASHTPVIGPCEDQRRSPARRPPPLVTPRSPVTEAPARLPRAVSQRDVPKSGDIGKGFSDPGGSCHRKPLSLGPHGRGDGRVVRPRDRCAAHVCAHPPTLATVHRQPGPRPVSPPCPATRDSLRLLPRHGTSDVCFIQHPLLVQPSSASTRVWRTSWS